MKSKKMENLIFGSFAVILRREFSAVGEFV